MCEQNKTEDLGTTPTGCHLFRRPNGVGGYVYFSDEIGGGVVVWDTALVKESTLLTAIVCEHHREYVQHAIDNGWKPSPKVELESDRMAATGGSFISNDLLKTPECSHESKVYLGYREYPTSIYRWWCKICGAIGERSTDKSEIDIIWTKSRGR